MKKLIVSLLLMICTVLSGSHYDPVHYYTNLSEFMGDRHGEFRGDFVVGLSDGSEWKVHPKDQALIGLWREDEIIRPQVRTSFYWFKREHKFELYNHNRKEAIRVMLVEHPHHALKIVRTIKYLDSVSVYYTYETLPHGGTIAIPHYTHHFIKDLFLMDGTMVSIRSNFNHFEVGDTVYIGTQIDKRMFIISCSR